MHLKHLFVSLIALGGATGFSIRSGGGAHLDTRADSKAASRTPSCPSSAYYSSDAGDCVCRKSGMVYKDKQCACPSTKVWNSATQACEPTCGTTEATWSAGKGACVCKESTKTYKNEACGCVDGEKLSGSKCVPDCGSEATYSKSAQGCVCKDHGKTYKNRACSCGDNEVYLSGKCTPDCGNAATYSWKSQTCICKEKGKTYGNDKSCNCPNAGDTYVSGRCKPACPSNAKYTGGECICENTNWTYRGGKCQCPENTVPYGTPRDKCKPTSCPSNAKYEEGVCTCNDSTKEPVNGVCIKKCDAETQERKGSECVCKNPEAYESLTSGGPCVKKCDKDTQDRSGSTCICKASSTEEILTPGGPCVKKCDKDTQDRSGTSCVCKEAETEEILTPGGPCVKKCDKDTQDRSGTSCVCKEAETEEILTPGGPCVKKCDKDTQDRSGTSCVCKEAETEEILTPGGPCVKKCDKDTQDRSGTSCVCKEAETEEILTPGGPCVKKCDKDTQDRSGTSCVCKEAETEEILTPGGPCVKKCDAETQDRSGSTCVCKEKNQEIDRELKCDCIALDQHVDDNTKKCVCTADDKELDTSKNCVCKVPETSPQGPNDECKCTDPDKEVYEGACVLTCPTGSSRADSGPDKGKCLCAISTQIIPETGERKCTCPSEKPVLYENRVCVKRCPTGSERRGSGEGTCECTISDQTIQSGEAGEEQCRCPSEKPKLYNDAYCVEDCPAESTRKGTERGVCECDIEDKTLQNKVGGGKECRCPAEKPNLYNDRHCVEDCPTGSTRKGTGAGACECDIEYQTLEDKQGGGKECKCPAGKPNLYNDNCVEECPTGSTRKGTGKGACECDISAQTIQDAESGGKECRCPSEKPKLYNDKYCVKECPTGSTRKGTGEGACECDITDQTIQDKTGGGQECACPSAKPNLYNDRYCVADCPTGSTRKGDGQGTCQCDITDQTLRNKPGGGQECKCPNERPTVYNDRYCVANCPTGSTRSGEGAGSCQCTTPIGSTIQGNRCACPADKPNLYNGNCVENCPEGSTQKGTGAGSCECNISAQTLQPKTGGGQECKCPSDKPNLYNRDHCVADCPKDATRSGPGSGECKCPNGKPTVYNNQCVANCPEGATRSGEGAGTCQCTSPIDSTLQSNGRCSCPSSKPNLSKGQCYENCPDPSGQNRDGATCTCKVELQELKKQSNGSYKCECPSDKPRISGGKCNPK